VSDQPAEPWWLAAVLSYPCPKCGAAPHDPCTTKTGTRASTPHAARGQERRRCRLCQVLLPQDQDLEDVLCGRCAMIRALELERITTHKRTEP
jgi:hypothetical protein